MKFFKIFSTIIKLIEKLEAVSSILEEVSKTTLVNLKKHQQILPIQEKHIKKIDKTVKKIEKFDDSLENIKRKLK